MKLGSMRPAVDPQLARHASLLSDEALLSQCDEAFFIGTGPGGQHRNKSKTAVRLTHKPTGLVATATERRSQAQNRSQALERLRALLVRFAHIPKPRKKTRPSRGAKERRIAEKKHAGRKKADRRGEF